jgi:tRNA pseudouridine38-40 synthase
VKSVWRFWLAYNGTRYCGWQFQPDQLSVESVLQKALQDLTDQSVSLTVAGRTDAGVHARGQVVSCEFSSRFDEKKMVLALSSKLPADVAVWRADIMPAGFNAKRHSIGKRYVYRVYQNLAADPFSYQTHWHLRRQLDLQAMQAAAQYFVGEHDFESFRSAHCEAEHARRYLWAVSVDIKNNLIEIDVRGNAFCHNMVRIIVGTLVEVGLGRRAAASMAVILGEKNRNLSGRTAPARGLFLETVYYPDDLSTAGIPTAARFPRYPVTKEMLQQFSRNINSEF